MLAGGPGALLSHRSPLCLWGWRNGWDVPFEVTACGAHRRPGIRFHEATGLTRRDVRHHLGIRVTSPARTALDVAPALSDKGLRGVVREARLSRHLRVPDLADVLAFCQRFGLPRPDCNVWVAGHRVDALFAAERLIVELDGY